MEATAATPRLDALARSYADDGFAIARGLISRDEVTTLTRAFTELAERGPIPERWEGDPRSAATDPLARWPRMMHPHRWTDLPIGALAMQYLLDPRVREILTALLGEEPLATQSMFYFKPPGARGQALHQDNFYLSVKPGSCIASWIALDGADAGNGGLSVVPGSHRVGVRCPEKADLTRSFVDHYVPPPAGMSPRLVELAPGDALFFNGSLIHGSGPNDSASHFRRSFICHYMPTSSPTISQWYRPILDFSGHEVARDFIDDGGWCGSPVAVKGPH
jgi:ectoine hydroxylase-related dioxygenase (phytanoyl-CoA dioxygenase family)